MRKEKLITRTIYTSVCTVMGINTKTNTVENQPINITGIHNDEKVIFELCKRYNKDEHFIPAKLIKTEIIEQLFGCTVEDFMSIAHLLPPRTKSDDEEE